MQQVYIVVKSDNLGYVGAYATRQAAQQVVDAMRVPAGILVEDIKH